MGQIPTKLVYEMEALVVGRDQEMNKNFSFWSYIVL